MNNPSQNKTQLKESADVEAVVQEYMDSLLVDLFPDVPDVAATESVEQTVTTELPVADAPAETLEESVIETQAQTDSLVVEQEVVAVPEVNIADKLQVEDPIVETPANASVEIQAEPQAQVEEVEPQIEEALAVQPAPKPEDLRYPKAPLWAQQAFDVLLFDVCGLKLAVPMESLGKIIKVDHETNHLIGRPKWFMGAYNENEQNLYVVDTAQYIMPEKGFDLSRDGYEYIIQLQRSQWTLACKKVHNTVRLEPDQVKWRSQQGKRQWLSGTVIDHMCALIHVDSLIDLLEAEVS